MLPFGICPCPKSLCITAPMMVAIWPLDFATGSLRSLGPAQVARGKTPLEQTSPRDVIVVIIGQSWLRAADADGRRRLEDAADTVRVQIEKALAASAMVIPVLLHGTQMPRHEELPPSLTQLCFQNGMQLRADPDFHRDVSRLLKAIRNPPRSRTLRKGMASVIPSLSRGCNGAFVGAVLAGSLWLVLLRDQSQFPVTLFILFAAWPFGWLLVWWRTRMARRVLLACLLLPLLLVVILLLTDFFGSIAVICMLFGIPTKFDDNQLLQNLRPVLGNMDCALIGALLGAFLGAAASAKKAKAIPPEDSVGKNPSRSLHTGIVIGSLLGFVLSWVLTAVLSDFPPATLNGEDNHWKVNQFIYFILEPLVILWTILGLVATSLEHSNPNSGP